MSAKTDVAIIGAGPNGLSIAAHLRHFGVDHVIAGHPMATWLDQMPKGMELKSEGFASTLYDPLSRLPLKSYCAERGLNYADLGVPVRLETFCDYGLAFQRAFAPDVIRKMVTSLIRIADGFRLRFDSGEELIARKVVLAVGITHFKSMPDELADVASPRVTHSSEHSDPAAFKDREVVVLGGGSSAIDLAGLLHEAGARVTLVARRDQLYIHDRMELPRGLRQRIMAPMSAVGPVDWSTWLTAEMPALFHFLADERKLEIVKSKFGPAAGWFMQDRVVGRIPILLRHDLRQAELIEGGVRLRLLDRNDDSHERIVDAEHLIAATGYRVDMESLGFLCPELRRGVQHYKGLPRLSRKYESSIPGLYFVGPAAMLSFGPSMRFACGARFAAPAVAKDLARGVAGKSKGVQRPVGLDLAPNQG